jgi:hypothetical protein
MKHRPRFSGGHPPQRSSGPSPLRLPQKQQWLQPTDEMKAHQVLHNEMRDLWHGRIENLFVVRGLPRITEQTKLFSRYRRGRSDPPRALRPSYSDRQPHPQHLKLRAHCRNVGDGVIDRIEVADGVPVFWGPSNQPDR